MSVDTRSDTERDKASLTPIHIKHIMRFFWSMRPSGTCVVCGSDNVGTPADSNNIATMLVIHTVSGETAYPAYMIGCGNCGHMHLFAERVINDWASENGED